MSAILFSAEPLNSPSYQKSMAEEAEKFSRQAKTNLAPVYPFLAEYLVEKFKLADKEGIGIDLGSGPGDLLIELAKRTKSMYWINADINPWYFVHFNQSLLMEGLSQRAGAVFADAQSLPFRDNYADVIVSRGSYEFWDNRKLGFSEIYRVLKTGGAAFIGRGLPENLPLEVAKSIRGGRGPKYEVEKEADELRRIMEELKIKDFEILIPHQEQKEVKYGIWIRFSK